MVVDTVNKTIMLCFQCSATERDWQNNLNFLPVKLYKNQESQMLVHRGFGRAYKTANDKVMTHFILECNEHFDFTPMICGWSYGGTMTQLACEDFYYRTGRKADAITFGSPKIFYGNKTKKYVLSCCRSIKQYAQPNDFVTWCVPLFFVHHLKKIKCGEKFSFKKIFNTSYYHCNYDKCF